MHVKVIFDDEEFNDIRRNAKELSDLLDKADKSLSSLREKVCLFIRKEMPADDAGTSPAESD